MRTATGVQIVDARREHIPFLAWVVLTAYRSHLPRCMWDFMLGDDEAKVLRFLEAMADTDTMHWGHWSLFRIAEVDGVPAAALCGFFDSELGIETVVAATAETNARLGISPTEAAAGWMRAKSVTNVSVKRSPEAWVVEHVATRPEFRRRGLVRRLIEDMLDRGRARAGTTAAIGVMIGNDPAQRAYENAGFEVTDESRDAEFEAVYGSPGIRMLQRAI